MSVKHGFVYVEFLSKPDECHIVEHVCLIIVLRCRSNRRPTDAEQPERPFLRSPPDSHCMASIPNPSPNFISVKKKEKKIMEKKPNSRNPTIKFAVVKRELQHVAKTWCTHFSLLLCLIEQLYFRFWFDLFLDWFFKINCCTLYKTVKLIKILYSF